MPRLKVDGTQVEVPEGASVLQACEAAGVEIPRFCYHDRLSVAGNCRMCLVDLAKAPKPIASCAFPAADGMEVDTRSDRVKKARKGVMEFLLINHPLDCPICDQGGECDLQDQAMMYGLDRSRYKENKRAVPEKYMGPLIRTIMTRCIQCTRCVRFASEVAGVEEIGLLHRGEKVEISTIERAVRSELSGNLVDICPVGALTSQPYAFNARPWELQKTQSVDVHNSMGQSIRIDSRDGQILRILPRLNEAVNEEWIDDKARYALDGLTRQRLDRPYIRRSERLEAVDWPGVLKDAGDRLKKTKPENMAFLVGDQVEAESLFALRSLGEALGVRWFESRQDGARTGFDGPASWCFNSTFQGIEEADAVLLVGSNPRWEAPLVNARIRKTFLEKVLPVFAVGETVDLTYEVENLGPGVEALESLLKGESPASKVLNDAERPLLVLGPAAVAREDGRSVLQLCMALAEKYAVVTPDWNGFNLISTAASRVAALDMGFVPPEAEQDMEALLKACEEGEITLLYNLAADEFDTSRLDRVFHIYQGHHGDAGAMTANLILPGAAYTEKEGLYMNMEGRVQRGHKAVSPPGQAQADWSIIRALFDETGKSAGFNNLTELREKLAAAYPAFAEISRAMSREWQSAGKWGRLLPEPFGQAISNFYMTDPISRNSETMARCSEVLLAPEKAEAAE